MLAFAAACLSARAAATASPDPYAIYGKARAYWEAARYPANVGYTVVVRVRERGVEKIEHFSSRYDSRRDEIHSSGVSAEEFAHPHVAPGGFNFMIQGARISKPEDPVDYLGVPLLAPNFSFGIAKYVPATQIDSAELVREIRAQFHDPARLRPALPESSGLKEIGSVEAIARDYAIRLTGIEAVDGHPDYHLSMHPLHQPQRYRLRDVWIDERSFATDKLITNGNFVDGPGPSASWTVTFSQAGTTPYIATERASSPLRFESRTYEDATISFEGISGVPRSAVDALATFATARGTLEEP